MIEAKNLKKVYETKVSKGLFKKEKILVNAVNDVSIRINKGEIIGFLGINGAGKTTTIKMLTTLISPTDGSYYVDGIDAIKNPMVIKKKINMVAGGERIIYWRLTAYENLWYYGSLYGLDSKLLEGRIDELLKLVGLYENKDKKVEEFSKGMKQRLQIARGLINDPEYLFMDEPTLGLDAIVSKELRKHIKSLAKEKNKGILLTSHYMEEVEELCDYIYILDKGKIINEGTAKELAKDTFSHITLKLSLYNEGHNFMESLLEILQREDDKVKITLKEGYYNIESKKDLRVEISEFCNENKILIKEIFKIEPRLEDIIIKLSNTRKELN